MIIFNYLRYDFLTVLFLLHLFFISRNDCISCYVIKHYPVHVMYREICARDNTHNLSKYSRQFPLLLADYSPIYCFIDLKT